MAVAVQRPQRQESDLDTIMKGLAVANQIFGIKANFDKLDAMKKQQELQAADQSNKMAEQERMASGELTQGEALRYQMQGGQLVPKGTEGAFGVPVQTTKMMPVEGGEPGDTEEIQTTEKMFFISPQAAAAEKKANELASKIANDKKIESGKRADKLRTEYNKASDDTFEAYRGYKKVEASANAKNPTGADDVALVFGFMKTIDPASTVREGEFATAEQTGSIDQRIVSTYNKLINGERLGPAQRQNFLQAAQRQFTSQLEAQAETDKRYKQLSGIAEVDEERVINPLFSELKNRLSQPMKQIEQPSQSYSVTFPIIESEAKAAPKPQTAREKVLADPDIRAVLGE